MRSTAAFLIALATAVTPAFATVVTPVPEPGTMMLVGGGIAATILIVRRRKRKGN